MPLVLLAVDFDLVPHAVILLGGPDVEDVVAPDQHLAQVPGGGAVDELLGVGELQVHVAVGGHQEPLVLMAPLQLDHHALPREPIEEWLGIYWHSSGHFAIFGSFSWMILIRGLVCRLGDKSVI